MKYYNMDEIRQATQEDIDKYLNYRQNHIDLVKKIGKEVFNRDYSNHDKDKLNYNDEDLNIVALGNKQSNREIRLNNTETKLLNALKFKHVTSNKHHPEYFDNSLKEELYNDKVTKVDASLMDKESLLEMCCDWCAVAIKLNKGLLEWYNKTVEDSNARFYFTDEQKQFIKDSILEIKDNIEDKDLHFKGKPNYKVRECVSSCGVSSNAPDNCLKVVKLYNNYLSESESISAGFVFGRFNPVTIGHLQLFKTLSNLDVDKKFIYTSHTQDKKKNPLSYATKIALLKQVVKDNNLPIEIEKSDCKTIIDVAVELYGRGYETIYVVGGSDRIDDLLSLLRRYNDVPNKEGKSYHFDNIDGVSAGDRDPDSDGISGVSASKVRNYALNDDFKNFIKYVPVNDLQIKEDIFNEIREVML